MVPYLMVILLLVFNILIPLDCESWTPNTSDHISDNKFFSLCFTLSTRTFFSIMVLRMKVFF